MMPPPAPSRGASVSEESFFNHIVPGGCDKVVANDIQAVQRMLTDWPGMATCRVTLSGKTLLHMACSADMVRVLVAAGSDIEAGDDRDGTALHAAAERGCAEVVTALLDCGAAIDARTLGGMTALHAAVAAEPTVSPPFWKAGEARGAAPGEGCDEVVRVLLERGASLDPGSAACGVLFDALRPASIRLLVKHGACVHQTDRDGCTPLLAAVANPKAEPDTVQALLDAGSDPGRANGGGCQPLHVAWRREHVLALVAAGADIQAAGPDGDRPLHRLIERGAMDEHERDEAVLAMLECGADVNAANEDGQTPLFLARRPGMALSLLEHGADPAVRDGNGRTAAEVQRQLGGEREAVAAVIDSWQAGLALRGGPRPARARRRA